MKKILFLLLAVSIYSCQKDNITNNSNNNPNLSSNTIHGNFYDSSIYINGYISYPGWKPSIYSLYLIDEDGSVNSQNSYVLDAQLTMYNLSPDPIGDYTLNVPNGEYTLVCRGWVGNASGNSVWECKKKILSNSEGVFYKIHENSGWTMIEGDFDLFLFLVNYIYIYIEPNPDVTVGGVTPNIPVEVEINGNRVNFYNVFGNTGDYHDFTYSRRIQCQCNQGDTVLIRHYYDYSWSKIFISKIGWNDLWENSNMQNYTWTDLSSIREYTYIYE